MATQLGSKVENKHFEEIEVGDTTVVEDARTITEADVVNFAGVSGDFHPQHMSKRFGNGDGDRRIAHGNLVFSIVHALAGVNAQAISYGFDGLRFVRPVRIGDTISVREEVTETEVYSDEYGRVVKEYEGTNQDGETVLVAEHILLVNRAD